MPRSTSTDNSSPDITLPGGPAATRGTIQLLGMVQIGNTVNTTSLISVSEAGEKASLPYEEDMKANKLGHGDVRPLQYLMPWVAPHLPSSTLATTQRNGLVT